QIELAISLGSSLIHLADCLGTRKMPYWTIGFSKPVIQSSISIYAASLMRYWVEECNRLHFGCEDHKNEGLKFMPRRIINVGRADDLVTKPFLEESAEPGPYIALSYCWGKTESLTTSNNNIQTLSKQIPLSCVPQTIRDAIAIARLLHVQYLWLDA